MSLIIGVMSWHEMQYQNSFKYSEKLERNLYNEDWNRYRWKPYCLWTCRKPEEFFLKRIEVS